MKLNDAVWGAVLGLFSAVILVHVQSFPTIPGQKVGPALFPGLIAVCLAVCAALLIIKGIASRSTGGERAHWFALDDWTRSRRHVIAFIAVVGVNVAYIAVVDKVGFIITGTVYLTLLFVVFGTRLRNALLLAVVVTLVIHYAFYKLLKVPLPWGVLERFAW
jgi:putative tricarboxylic transport membrane protein